MIWQDAIANIPKGRSPGVRQASNVDELRSYFDKWRVGGEPVATPAPKVEEAYTLPDGSRLQWRGSSTSGGEAIDITLPGARKDKKIHL